MDRIVKPYGDMAPFASRPEDSRGRLYPEEESRFRTVFQRDRDRIIHSKAFRRLKHKTQVFVYHEGDYYRTRLTHSLEVSQIARSISRFLGLNEDLAEALALAHDFGHPPFGHSGEDGLAAVMKPYGGFNHNIHSLRLLTSIEQRYAEFDGLNLTWETLEGIAKHNGPLCRKGEEAFLDPLLQDYLGRHDLEIHTFASAEAQVAALADDIAYNNHDIDDGLRAGLFALGDLSDLPLVGPVLAGLRQHYPGLDGSRLKHEMVRRMIDLMVSDLMRESCRRIDEARVDTAQQVRELGAPVIAFSEEMKACEKVLRAFLMEHMYRHPHVAAEAKRAKHVVGDLFHRYMAEPSELPAEHEAAVMGHSAETGARAVADFIAGMTDRFALMEHERLFGTARA
ncbi:deoxyguanosinetriphosphate triphosphohydrolase [Emcibacter sp. SYSU 3D8]|uniref:deoxyguanosinetriphosphate triphosphohydrolase n=1 Tax=Emcibacter sp. SYSU 3D8 TaxID=3133969 RepID=UPI0031FE8BDE